MEIPNIPIKPTVSKSSSASQIDGKQRAAAKAYGGGAADSGDSLNLSANGKLLQALKSEYTKLEGNEGNAAKVEDLKSRLQEEGRLALSAEDLVAGILQGTLFEV